MAEFEAWAAFCGLNFPWSKRAFGSGHVPIAEIVKAHEDTSRLTLKEHYEKVIERERTSGDLKKVVLCVEDFTSADVFYRDQDTDYDLIVKARKRRKELEEFYRPISGRKYGWSLLGIKNTESLKTVLRASFELDVAKKILKSDGMDIGTLCILIARKQKIGSNRTGAANNRTKRQRQGAAEKGHKTRAKGKTLTPNS